MPETLHPGLYIQEISGSQPMEGVATSTAGFVGVAEKGPMGVATFVSSFNQYLSLFGGYIADGYLTYAVRSFFENGGSRAYIVRTNHYTTGVKSSSPSTENLVDATTPTAADVVTVNALYDGEWGDDIDVAVTDWDNTAKTFNLAVSYKDEVVETYEACTLTDLESLINGVSNYIVVDLLSATPGTVSFKNQTIALDNGANGLEGIVDADYIGAVSYKNGLYAFDPVKVNLISVPGITSTAVLQGLVTYAEGRKDCFALLDMPTAKTPSTAITYKQTTVSLVSQFASIYWPWVYAFDPVGVGKSPKKLLPPSGFIAGIISRIDNSRGVWKAAAGTEAYVRGALSLEYNCNDAEQDTLNPIGINVIRAIDGSGIISWGARTCSKDADYKYQPVRRTNTFIESSILNNLTWAVFEPNNELLWGRVKATVESFLRNLWKQGGLKGASEKDAFFVVCDGTINTQDVIDVGRMYVDIGVANLKPAEFIVFRLSVKR